jgi:hypothetical protein
VPTCKRVTAGRPAWLLWIQLPWRFVVTNIPLLISRLLMNLSAGVRPANPAGTAAFAVECGSLATSESIDADVHIPDDWLEFPSELIHNRRRLGGRASFFHFSDWTSANSEMTLKKPRRFGLKCVRFGLTQDAWAVRGSHGGYENAGDCGASPSGTRSGQ